MLTTLVTSGAHRAGEAGEGAWLHVTTIDGEIQTWLPDTNFSNIQKWKGSNGACIAAFLESPDAVQE